MNVDTSTYSGIQTIVKDFVPAADWDQDNTLMFNIQMLNAEVFERVGGIKPPPTPVSAKTYAPFGEPFCKMYEGLSGVKGDFPVQSVAQLDAAKGKKGSRDDDENSRFNEVSIDRSGAQETFTSVEELETRVNGLRIATDF
ncbi:hypothetical protein NHQ30_008155 [Ciborinia camelliae]|nr:hypothetical protein NHQ30_008155 [Ciborinia camelliae]